MKRTDLAGLEAKLGLAFRQQQLLEQALIHTSYVHENPDLAPESNERMEFLGDAILGFLVAEHLFSIHPALAEGRMTTLRAALVRGETLARWARAIDLGRYLYLGKGELTSGGRTRAGLLAAAFEALVAAVTLDQGLEATRGFLTRFLQPEIERLLKRHDAKDFKTRLQERLQSQRQITPTYRTVGATGPDHDRVFEVEVLAGEEVLSRGRGRSKQQAEQQAARQALATLPDV